MVLTEWNDILTHITNLNLINHLNQMLSWFKYPPKLDDQPSQVNQFNQLRRPKRLKLPESDDHSQINQLN